MADASLPVKEVKVLEGVEDRYEGILVDDKSLPDDPEEFNQRLELSLQVNFVQAIVHLRLSCK